MKAEEKAAAGLAKAVAAVTKAMDAALPPEATRDPEAWLAEQEAAYAQAQQKAQAQRERRTRERVQSWRRY